jgi:hypothetical protein
MWPDFDEADLISALGDFDHRERRFGTIPAAPIESAISMPENAQ